MTFSSDDVIFEQNGYNCVGCKSNFPDSRYVTKHVVGNIDAWFCLNCEDWIQDKTMVFTEG